MKKLSEHFYRYIVGIMGILSVTIFVICLSNLVYGKPSSLNTGCYPFLVVIDAVLISYVIVTDCIVRYRAKKTADMLEKLDYLTSRENPSDREVFKRILQIARLLPEEKLDEVAESVDRNFSAAISQIEIRHYEEMAKLLVSAEELLIRTENLQSSGQELQSVLQELKDISARISFSLGVFKLKLEELAAEGTQKGKALTGQK